MNTHDLFIDLLINHNYIDKIYGFCYKRTYSKYEAEELTHEIIAELLVTFNKNPQVEYINGYIWSIANNIYAKWVSKIKKRKEVNLQDFENTELSKNNLENDILYKIFNEQRYKAIIREISFLSKTYRDAMIMFYLDEKSIAEIANVLCISENSVKQRLFMAKQKIKKGISCMNKNTNLTLKPNNLYLFYDMVTPSENRLDSLLFNNPYDCVKRLLSQNILILCKSKAKSPNEISTKLNVPNVFIENEFNILMNNGFLKKTNNNKYIADFIMIDWEVQGLIKSKMEEYSEQFADEVLNYVQKNKEKIMGIDYLVKIKDLSFILWSMIPSFASSYNDIIEQKVMSNLSDYGIEEENRGRYAVGKIVNPNDKDVDMRIYNNYSMDFDDFSGYKKVEILYFGGSRLPNRVDHMWFNNPEYLLMLNCLDGLLINDLSDYKKEVASKAISHKFIKKEGKKLYPNVLIFDGKGYSEFCDIIQGIKKEIGTHTEKMVEEYLNLIKKYVPHHLKGQSRGFIELTSTMREQLIEKCIEKKLLNIPDEEYCTEGIITIIKN